MTDQSPTSSQTTSKDLSSVTFSQASADGLTHSGWLIGPKTGKSGRDRVHVSHLVSREKVEELTTSAIYGPLFGGSSPSEDLQLCLANRLRVRMAAYGSPEYELTWKQWDLQSEPPICALRASGRRISGNGCGGWQSPNVIDATGRQYQYVGKGRKKFLCLPGEPIAAGWQTPKTPTGGACERNTPGGGLQKLEDQVELLTGWATPAARDYRSEEATDEFNQKRWDHPRGKPLSAQCGTIASLSPAPMGNPEGYRLNPYFSLWLQGYPIEWGRCAGLGTV